MVTNGSGIGSRRSYSLYSRFSIRHTLVYVGRSICAPLPSLSQPARAWSVQSDTQGLRDRLGRHLDDVGDIKDDPDPDREHDELREPGDLPREQEEQGDDRHDHQEQWAEQVTQPG